MSSNRELKIRLYREDPHCHWCKRKTVLTNVKEIKGKPDPLMATVDHLISRFDIRRWVKPQPGEKRKVLACFECNNKRASQEAKLLPNGELFRRGFGFTLNPEVNGKAIFNKMADSVDEAVQRVKKAGIDVSELKLILDK